MDKLIIEVNREGYSTEQVGRTMTVGELIAALEQYDEDTLIYTSHDRGYTFGGISESDFRMTEEMEDY